MNKYKSLLIVLCVCSILQHLSAGLVKVFMDTSLGVFYFSVFVKMIWIPVAVWVYKDAEKTLFLPWLWAILILFLNTYGLIMYLLVQLLSQREESNTNG